MLAIKFSQVKNNAAAAIKVTDKVEIRPEFLARSQKLIYQVKDIQLTGVFFYEEPYVTGNYQVKADLVVPSSRSLKPVPYQADFTFRENYTEAEIPAKKLEESEITLVKVDHDTIDLQTAVEDNILLHLPTTILTAAEEEQGQYPSGAGWSVISEAEYAEDRKERINPAFAKLKELLKQDINDKT
ncbi:DUF177 domain-containing protein [Lactobacillus xylocopicola]|uniref:DNA-binding protein n=1 Tax=Lactobacillus xylocopicola TaxID=2976676 RepID=A0ABM8BHG8_9LACO|nr:DUF177 domain-containing protein [Lactobacillus xylocopicola]BDR60732.1 DNA-binding protein [Lactobacillus xylocopicola]